MIYEVVCSVGLKTKSLGKYFKSKDKAQEYANDLNKYMHVYSVRRIKLEDGDE